MQFPARLKVVAASDQLKQLRVTGGTGWFDGIDMVPLELDERLPEEMLADVDILVVQVDLGVPESMLRIEWVRKLKPELSLIVALADADIRLVRTLVRQGVADVVALPLVPEELLQTTPGAGYRLLVSLAKNGAPVEAKI